MLLGGPRAFVMEHAYWGEDFSGGEVEDFLGRMGAAYERFRDEDKLLDRVVDLMKAQKVVAWFQLGFEWGPRALGNRSILADPRNFQMKDIVNAKIKFREPYRPFAPSVLADRCEDLFTLPDPKRHYPARFMLYVVDVKEQSRETFPAVTHVDGTGRVQIVFKDHSHRYYRLIKRFSEATGVPVVLNTSFNLRGEPIVTTPADAFSTFDRSGMDALVMNEYLVRKA